jgi:lipopolysaccharide/colanic/teichoic acid biosynthesis glycosyltransferase
LIIFGFRFNGRRFEGNDNMVQKLIGMTIAQYCMKRFFDLATSILALLIFSVPMLLIALFVKLTSRGPALHWSDRIGRNNTTFKMPKFRTMEIYAPEIATHLLNHPDRYLTPLGGFLALLYSTRMTWLPCGRRKGFIASLPD